MNVYLLNFTFAEGKREKEKENLFYSETLLLFSIYIMRSDISISCIKMPSIRCYDQKIIPQLQALKA